MARVTVEDCLEKVGDSFKLVLVAAKRSNQLSRGTHKTTLSTNGDKPSVIALREIAAGIIDESILNDDDDISTGYGVDMAEVESELSNVILDENSIDSIIDDKDV